MSEALSIQTAIIDEFSKHPKTSKDLINFVINNVTKLIDVITEQDQLIQDQSSTSFNSLTWRRLNKAKINI